MRLDSGDGGVERVDALLAADLERHDHLGEDHGLAQGHERQLADRRGRPAGGGLRLRHLVLLGLGPCGPPGAGGGPLGPPGSWGSWFAGAAAAGRDQAPWRAASLGRRGAVLAAGTRSFVVERLEDADAEALLQLEEDADPGEVRPALLGQVPDPEDPADVLVRVEADVRRRARRLDQALVLVDPERPRVDRDDPGGDGDDVDGAGRVPIEPAAEHARRAVSRPCRPRRAHARAAHRRSP